ncbi:hypothetical protein FCOIX_3613 [Fusarium coicis]|nr:hypothetical protein FCOIX_3613 [Fusarium coicis]
MCEFNDEDISHDPNPFSTVPPPSGPSGPSGSSEPQDSITANPLPERFWEAGEPEELENSPPAKRLQPEQHSLPTPVKTHLAREARSDISSPLQSWDPDLDMPGPSPCTERPSTPPRYPSPSFRPTARPVRDISNSSHAPISQQRNQEKHLPQSLEQRQDEQGIPNQGISNQGIPKQGVSGPSRKPENIPSRIGSLEQLGRALLLLMEQVPEKDRDQLVQLVPAELRGHGSCKADRLCLYRSAKVNVLDGDHKRYLIKIKWPQDSMMKMDIEALLSKKLFPKMVGDFRKVGLMAREWLKYSGYVNPHKMFQILEEEIKPTKKQGDELVLLWRLACDRKQRQVVSRPSALSEILDMGDTYI